MININTNNTYTNFIRLCISVLMYTYNMYVYNENNTYSLTMETYANIYTNARYGNASDGRRPCRLRQPINARRYVSNNN